MPLIAPNGYALTRLLEIKDVTKNMPDFSEYIVFGTQNIILMDVKKALILWRSFNNFLENIAIVELWGNH